MINNSSPESATNQLNDQSNNIENVKPFKTIEEQIKVLKSRNVIIDEDGHKEFSTLLLRENYYTVVNGYKDAFIDKQKTNEIGEDYYQDGTSWAHFMFLYTIDKELRDKTFSVILEAENIIKNSLIYSFSYYNPEKDSYLDPKSYCEKNDYPSEHYTRNLIRLLNVLQNAHDNKSKTYIKHYLDHHRHVPMWVISKTLTFGNISAFYDLQKRNVKARTCINICKSTSKNEKDLNPRRLQEIFKILVPYRNICAHGERLYCARVGKRGYFSFKDLLTALYEIIDHKHMKSYLSSISRTLKYLNDMEDLRNIVFKAMNISQIDLDVLKNKLDI